MDSVIARNEAIFYEWDCFTCTSFAM